MVHFSSVAAVAPRLVEHHPMPSVVIRSQRGRAATAFGRFTWPLLLACASLAMPAHSAEVPQLLYRIGSADRFTADSSYAYVAGDGSVTRVPLSGGAPAKLADHAGNVTAICVFNGWVYWAEYGPQFAGVKAVPREGGAMVRIAEHETYNYTGSMAVDDSGVYYDLHVMYSDGGAMRRAELATHPLVGQSTYLTGTLVGVEIQLDESSVYWTERWWGYQSYIKRVAKNGASYQTLLETPFRAGEEIVASIVIDGTHVYYGAGNFMPIRRIPKEGGVPAAVSRNWGTLSGVTVDDEKVYACSPNAETYGVWAFKKDGSSPEGERLSVPPTADFGYPRTPLIRGGRLYWQDREGIVSIPLSPAASAEPTVLFIPGIGGSELRDSDHVRRWPNEAIVETGGNVEALWFDADGVPKGLKSQSVMATQVLSQVAGRTVYQWETLKSTLEDAGRHVVPVPYDFRCGLDNSARGLRAWVLLETNQDPTKRVDIVAHSMGGLVAVRYLQLFSPDHRVRRIVTLGTPFEGAPRALHALRAGWDLDKLSLSDRYVKRMAHNWPGLYALLPSISLQRTMVVGPSWYRSDTPVADPAKYWLSMRPVPPDSFEMSLGTILEPNAPPYNPLKDTDPEFHDHLSASILSPAFVCMAELEKGLPGDVTALIVASVVTDDAGIPLESTPYHFFEGLSTYEEASNAPGYALVVVQTPRYWLGYGEGDRTVPLSSATALTGPKVTSAVLSGTGEESEHMGLVKNTAALELTKTFLKGEPVSWTGARILGGATHAVVFRSPVSVVATDSKGRQTSIGTTITEGSPSLSAEYWGEAKVLIFPAGTAVDIAVNGTGEGKLTIEFVTSASSGMPVDSQVWFEFPVSTYSTGQLRVSPEGQTSFAWDVDGDGIREYAGGPDSDGDGVPDERDKYPQTPLDATVNQDGGCLAQIVPLSGSWKNQGQFIEALTREAQRFVDGGLMTGKEKGAAVALGTQLFQNGKTRYSVSGPSRSTRTHWQPMAKHN